MIKVKNVRALQGLNPNKSYLVLINPERIPHLVAVVNNKYFSLTNRKSVIGEDFDAYFNFLKRSNKKVLFIELNDTSGNIDEAFKQYSKVDSKHTTCLEPIKKWLQVDENVDFVFNLIPLLQGENRISAVWHFNMEEELDKLGDFKLSQYSKEDIYSYIDKLNKKYV